MAKKSKGKGIAKVLDGTIFETKKKGGKLFDANFKLLK